MNDDVKQLQMDLHHLGVYISPKAAQKMVDAGWKKRFEPMINHNVIPQTQNEIPDLRQAAFNHNEIYISPQQARALR